MRICFYCIIHTFNCTIKLLQKSYRQLSIQFVVYLLVFIATQTIVTRWVAITRFHSMQS